MSTPSDLQQLLDMGFDKEKAEIAVKKTGGCMYKFQLAYPLYMIYITPHTDYLL